MTAKTELSAPKRPTRGEVQKLVAEFVSSGMRRSEFCQSRGLTSSTLDRHLKKLRWKRRRKPISSGGRLGEHNPMIFGLLTIRAVRTRRHCSVSLVMEGFCAHGFFVTELAEFEGGNAVKSRLCITTICHCPAFFSIVKLNKPLRSGRGFP